MATLFSTENPPQDARDLGGTDSLSCGTPWLIGTPPEGVYTIYTLTQSPGHSFYSIGYGPLTKHKAPCASVSPTGPLGSKASQGCNRPEDGQWWGLVMPLETAEHKRT